MSLSKQSRESLLDAILSITDNFGKQENAVVTDLYFQVDKRSGVITIFDDDDRELAKANIAEWDASVQEHTPSKTEKTLRTELLQMQKVGLFDKMNILKPYSCTLVDENKESIVDLLYIDDETLILDTELLKGLDQEMDEFLKYLLEE
ncbi:MAG: hypothetical protein IJW68_06610 [Bacteroidaceae bacterium]|nr:hypothetical protein [Bacteroidaceae bacterium]MBQ8735715.1 hypothetical protein [Bacteroidaceae bacterium]